MTTNSDYVPCEVLELISYSASQDTQITVEQVRKYNAVYISLCKKE